VGIIVVLWVICAIGGYAIGNSKGRAAQGFWLGALLSVIGLIIIAGMGSRDISNRPPPKMLGEARGCLSEAPRRGTEDDLRSLVNETDPVGPTRFDVFSW
jgi:hypothetical protein